MSGTRELCDWKGNNINRGRGVSKLHRSTIKINLKKISYVIDFTLKKYSDLFTDNEQQSLRSAYKCWQYRNLTGVLSKPPATPMIYHSDKGNTGFPISFFLPINCNQTIYRAFSKKNYKILTTLIYNAIITIQYIYIQIQTIWI